MIIGFTGSRKGMSEKQRLEVQEYLKSVYNLVFSVVHGGCTGADMDFHLETEFCWREVRPGHPKGKPEDNSMHGDYSDADEIHPAEPYFQRNRKIVDESDILLACPYNNIEKGGTWYTINYAKKTGKNVIIFER